MIGPGTKLLNSPFALLGCMRKLGTKVKYWEIFVGSEQVSTYIGPDNQLTLRHLDSDVLRNKFESSSPGG